MVTVHLQFFFLFATSAAVQVNVENDINNVRSSETFLLRRAQRSDSDRAALVDSGWGHAVMENSRARSNEVPVLEPPSTEPYNLTEPADFSHSQYKQDLTLLPILKQLSPGFFVESGGLDGKFCSNTLYYERNHGWKGLLVEPDPRSFRKIHGEHRRHAYAFQGCLSPTGHAENLHFDLESDGGHSRIEGNGNTYAGRIDRITSVKAQPLQSLLETIGQNVVDFWSLDIEGSEGKVLKSTDFSKIEVGVLLIEMNKNDANNNEIQEVMTREGFVNIGHHFDQIFINPKYFQKRGLAVPTSEMLPQTDRA